MSGGIKIPVGVAFDKGAEEQAVLEFTEKFNKLGDAIARAGKQKFEPINRGSLEDLRRLTSGFDSLKKVSGDLNKRLRATGQDKTPFLDVDWSKLYPDQHSRGRQMQKAFDYVNGGSARFTPPPVPSPGAPPAPGQPPASPPNPPRTPNYARNIVGAGLGAMGPAGNVANGALSAGMAGGVGAGLAGLAGGLAALAIGKVIGSVREKIGAAQQEFIGYDTLKRTLGDVNVSFNTLRDSMREASRGMDMTFEEGQQLGMQFAKLSGLSGEQHKTLGEEVQHAGGFGRSFGVDPSQSNAFFAQMRTFRVTGNVEDSRRLGLMIGESIAKSNAFSKVDEVLDAIAGYTAMQTRAGMNAANVTGYAGALTGLMGSGVPGLDPASAAALLGRVNSSIAGGGSAGEAGQNFLYTALGSRLGLDPIQTAIMREQGAFGTGAGTFGEGSMYSRFAEKYKLDTPKDAAGSNATNLELIMEQLKKVYSDKPELMVNAMSNLFGVNNSQAMALATIDPKSLGGLADRLKKNGVNINDVNATGISRIAQIEADKSMPDAEKDQRIKEAATQHQEETEGSRTRATINGVERAIQDLAGKMVPLMNDMRSGIMYLAGEKGKNSPREIMEAVAKAESKDRIGMVTGKLDPEISEAEKKRELLKGKIVGVSTKRDEAAKWGDEKQRDELNEKLRQLEREEAESQARISALKKERADKLEEESRRIEQEIQAIRKPVSIDPGAEQDWQIGGAGAGRGTSNDQRRLDRGGSSTSTAALPSGQQAELADQAQQYFVSKGWTREQAAGIVANLHAESGMRSGVTGDDGAAYGLAQWHADRQAAFKEKFGKDIRSSTFEEQLEFVNHEMTAGNEQAAGNRLRGSRTAAEAAQVVTRYYERPADKDGEATRRGALADRLGRRDLEPSAPQYAAGSRPSPSTPASADPRRDPIPATPVPAERRRDPLPTTPLPEGPRPGDGNMLAREDFRRAEISGTFHLLGPTGQPAAAPIQVATRVAGPNPAGTRLQ